jgi:L-fucose isomerase-like protein
MVVVMLEDPWKKQLAGLVCSINRISNELALTSIEKDFFVKNMKDKTSHDVVVKWNEFIELLKIVQDKSPKGVSKGFKPCTHELQGI